MSIPTKTSLTVEEVIERLLIRIAMLTEEYERQSAMTKAPGNPYITGLGARIAGLEEAVKLLKEAL